MNRNTREWMERWARWRHYRYGGFGKTMTEKFVEGMPGTRCPGCGGTGKRAKEICTTCFGAGHVPMTPGADKVRTASCAHCYVQLPGEKHGRSTGEVNGRTCVLCRGSGVRTTIENKVNPAHIRSTYQTPDDPVSQRIDRLVCELRQRDVLLGYYFVVWAEYCDGRGGTEVIKAQRLLLTTPCYRKRLQRAVEWIGSSVHDRRSCDVIPFPYKAA
jgi:hypothetical protein